MKRISLIVPCLNEEEAIPAFKQEIDRVFKECLEGYAPGTYLRGRRFHRPLPGND